MDYSASLIPQDTKDRANLRALGAQGPLRGRGSSLVHGECQAVQAAGGAGTLRTPLPWHSPPRAAVVLGPEAIYGAESQRGEHDC